MFRKSVCIVAGTGQLVSHLLCEAVARLPHLKWFLPLSTDSSFIIGTVDLATSQHSRVTNFSFESWTRHLHCTLFKCQYVYLSSPHPGGHLHESRDDSLYFLETTSVVPVCSVLHSRLSYTVQQFSNDIYINAACTKLDSKHVLHLEWGVQEPLLSEYFHHHLLWKLKLWIIKCNVFSSLFLWMQSQTEVFIICSISLKLFVMLIGPSFYCFILFLLSSDPLTLSLRGNRINRIIWGFGVTLSWKPYLHLRKLFSISESQFAGL